MPKKCSNGYVCISDEEQSRIWEIYDNIEEIAIGFNTNIIMMERSFKYATFRKTW